MGSLLSYIRLTPPSDQALCSHRSLSLFPPLSSQVAIVLSTWMTCCVIDGGSPQVPSPRQVPHETNL